jgi:hypothetical protein
VKCPNGEPVALVNRTTQNRRSASAAQGSCFDGELLINVGAEVFFLAVLLGYAWSKMRQQFKRL